MASGMAARTAPSAPICENSEVPAPTPHDRPQPDGSDLRAVGAADVPSLSAAMARAFATNPGMSWTYRDPTTRPRKLERSFAFFLERIWLPRGESFTTTALGGAACWLPPGGWHLPVGLQVRLAPGFLAIARWEIARMTRWVQITERKHPREPHWYLALLGVDPTYQGRGFGSHLMQPVLQRCDRERTPAYLETDTERNVALYERHDFAVTEKFDLPSGGPPIWLMWREPRAEAKGAG